MAPVKKDDKPPGAAAGKATASKLAVSTTAGATAAKPAAATPSGKSDAASPAAKAAPGAASRPKPAAAAAAASSPKAAPASSPKVTTGLKATSSAAAPAASSPKAAAAPKPGATAAAASPKAAAAKPAAAVAKPAAVAAAAAAKPAATAASKPKAAGTKAAAGVKAGVAKPAGSKGTAPSSADKKKATAAAAAAGAAAAGGADAAVSDAAAQAAAAAAEDEERRLAERAVAAEAEMESLRKAAWLAQVEYERRQEDKARRRREEEARRKKEEAALRKALLEAAFDGEEAELDALLARAGAQQLLGGADAAVECADAHGNTLLSEAAAGGSAGAVSKLLQLGADPNTQGEFKRTPLWRAAFLGHGQVVALLLEGGADPRIGNEGGELPHHVAGDEASKALLAAWDTARTDSLLARIEERKAARAAAQASERAQAVAGAEQRAEAAEQEHARCQQTLKHARMELEKRIYEHDLCVEEHKPPELVQATLDQIHVQEKTVEEARIRAASAQEALDGARLALREKQQAAAAAEAAAAAAAGGEGGDATDRLLPGVPVEVKALNDVLLRDVGGRLKANGRWPLVIDASGQASVFLRYQDTNYVNALNARHVEPHMLRRALLGALRYGKPLVVDLMDCDGLWAELPRIFDQVQKGLWASLLDKSLLAGDKYQSLLRPEDGEEYEANRFCAERLAAFSVIVLTGVRRPCEDMTQRLHAFAVIVRE